MYVCMYVARLSVIVWGNVVVVSMHEHYCICAQSYANAHSYCASMTVLFCIVCLVPFCFSHSCSCLLREGLEPSQLYPHCWPSLVVTVCVEYICFNSSVHHTHQTDETFASCGLLVTFHSVWAARLIWLYKRLTHQQRVLIVTISLLMTLLMQSCNSCLLNETLIGTVMGMTYAH